MTDAPALGDVWRYPFLWSREAAAGESEGRKDRPVALAMLTRNRDGEMVVVMVPITSQPSEGRSFAVEVPEIEKKRAGLDQHLRLWAIVDEANADIPARSFYFEPNNRLGGFSSAFVKRVQREMIMALKARKLRTTSRF